MTAMKIKGIDSVIADLELLADKTPKALNRTVERAASFGQNVAKATLIQTDHTQKFGDQLAEEIGLSVMGDTAKIYTPVNDTHEMRAHMAYAEFGAGITTKPSNEHFTAPPQRDKKGKTWTYWTTPSDKNPIQFKGRSGVMLGRTNKSEPARFMYTARKEMELKGGVIFKEEMRK